MRKTRTIIFLVPFTLAICLVSTPSVSAFRVDTGQPSLDELIVIDIMPEIISKTVPEYPAQAVDQGIEGTVTIKALIDKQGNPVNVLVAKSSGEKILDEAALKAAEKYKFRPGMKDSQPVAIWVSFTVSFTLSESGEKITSRTPDDFIALDAMPQIIYEETPEYPKVAQEQGLQGTVTLKAFIDKKGNPVKVQIAKSSGAEVLDKAAMEAAKKSRFSAGVQQGEPVGAWVSYSVVFKL